MMPIREPLQEVLPVACRTLLHPYRDFGIVIRHPNEISGTLIPEEALSSHSLFV